METGKKYRGIGQTKERENGLRGDREVVLEEMRDGVSRNDRWH